MKRNLVLLSVLLFFGFVTEASAQVTYQVTTTPTFVINTGRSEALGSIRITATSPTGTLTSTSTVQFLFANIGCDNTGSGAATVPPGPQTGIQLVTDGTFVTASISSVTNTSAGCVVSVTVPPGIAVTTTVSYLELQGVRGRVDLSPAGAPAVGVSINGILTASPSTSSLFTVPNQGVVGVSAKALQADFTEGSALNCIGALSKPDVTITELFNTAFVQYVPPPVNGRPQFGATNNTEFHIVVTSLPSNIKLAWPAASTTDEGTGLTGAFLALVSQSTAGDDAVYSFNTPNQALSDLNSEVFEIAPSPNVPSDAGFGVANAEAQLFPPLSTGDATAVTDPPFPTHSATSFPIPRFNDCLQGNGTCNSPQPFFSNAPCVTDLLFPFVANTFGFDTGIAIANSSLDPWNNPATPAITVPVPTLSQNGTCTLYGFPQATPADTGATPAAMVTFTSPSVQAGDTFTMILSSSSNPVFNGFEGYIIAVCNFQYAHGFAFIQTPVGGSPSAAEGYVALVIPDPVVQGAVYKLAAPSRAANNTDFAFFNSGEGLSQ